MTIKIIAEVGVNHNGSIKTAKKYIDICKSIGVDFVKFQIANPDLVVTKNAPKADYQKLNSQVKETQLKMLKEIHLSMEDYKELYFYSKRKKVKIVFSAFDNLSYKFLMNLKPNFIKIASGEIDNFFDLRNLKNYRGKLFISTGMSKINDINELIKFLRKIKIKNNQIILMHCNSDYPTQYKDVNLNVLDQYKKKYNFELGYSDHTIDDLVPLACAVKKINYLEKHITFSKKLKGPDHKASMEIKSFINMIKKIKAVEECLGSKSKHITKSENINKKNVRKSLRVIRNIKKGERIKENDIISMRPADGVSPKYYTKYINKKSKRNYTKFEKI